MNIPKNEPKTLVQARVSKKDLDLLRKHNVDIPELIRQSLKSAAINVADIPERFKK